MFQMAKIPALLDQHAFNVVHLCSFPYTRGPHTILLESKESGARGSVIGRTSRQSFQQGHLQTTIVADLGKLI